MLQLQSLRLKTGVLQAPMAGCTDLAFRLIGRGYGLEFAFSEMIASEALIRNNQKTLTLLKNPAIDKPIGVQLVGSNPERMGMAAAMIETMGFDLLDLNCGCPVHKITGNGAGAALLREPGLAKRIFENVTRRVRRIPGTVKIRKGYADASGDEAFHLAKIAEQSGIAAITVHGRLSSQGYTGKADWDIIARIKQAVKIPVIGNGDVKNAEDAKRLVAVSGCDAIMVGRAALGNPWLYGSIHAALAGTDAPPPPSLEDVKKTVLQHVALEAQHDHEKMAILKCRRIVCWYFKNVPRGAEFRNRIHRSRTLEETREIIEEFCRGWSALLNSGSAFSLHQVS